jgi:hypothetical protein
MSPNRIFLRPRRGFDRTNSFQEQLGESPYEIGMVSETGAPTTISTSPRKISEPQTKPPFRVLFQPTARAAVRDGDSASRGVAHAVLWHEPRGNR